MKQNKLMVDDCDRLTNIGQRSFGNGSDLAADRFLIPDPKYCLIASIDEYLGAVALDVVAKEDAT